MDHVAGEGGAGWGRGEDRREGDREQRVYDTNTSMECGKPCYTSFPNPPPSIRPPISVNQSQRVVQHPGMLLCGCATVFFPAPQDLKACGNPFPPATPLTHLILPFPTLLPLQYHAPHCLSGR